MITKDSVAKALGALEAASPDLAKGGEGSLSDTEGAATGGGDGSLKAPGEPMSNAAKGKAKKSLAKGEFPPKKAAADDDDGDEDDDDDSMKSFAEDMPNEVKTKIDVSQFLRSLVDHNASTIESMRKAILKSTAAQDSRLEVVLDAVESLQKSQANIGIVLRAMCERIGVIENTPGTAKSQTAAAAPVVKSQTAAAAPVAREFVADGQETPEGGQAIYKALNGKSAPVQKAMISEAICQLVMKGEAKDTDVINFETYGLVPTELDSKLRAALN